MGFGRVWVYITVVVGAQKSGIQTPKTVLTLHCCCRRCAEIRNPNPENCFNKNRDSNFRGLGVGVCRGGVVAQPECYVNPDAPELHPRMNNYFEVDIFFEIEFSLKNFTQKTLSR